MKKQKLKMTQEQIEAARQKKLSSSDFRGRVKKIIESLKIFNNNSKKEKLSKKDIRDLAFTFADRMDVSSVRIKEPSALESALDDTAPKNSIKY